MFASGIEYTLHINKYPNELYIVAVIYAYQCVLPVSHSVAIHFCGYHPLRKAIIPLCFLQPIIAAQKCSPFYWPEGLTLIR